MDLHKLLLSLLCDNRAGSNIGWEQSLVARCPRARTPCPRICVWTLLRSLYFSSEAVNVSVLRSRERCCSSQRLYQGMDTALPITQRECPSSPFLRLQDSVLGGDVALQEGLLSALVETVSERKAAVWYAPCKMGLTNV